MEVHSDLNVREFYFGNPDIFKYRIVCVFKCTKQIYIVYKCIIHNKYIVKNKNRDYCNEYSSSHNPNN